MKKITFKKGVNKIVIPFMLHDLTAWQAQVHDEMQKFNAYYSYPKKAKLGFEITEIGANLILSK